MTTEFAVVDQDGVLFGMPAKTFTSLEAAQAVLENIAAATDRMRDTAIRAEKQLEDKTLSTAIRDDAMDTIRAWNVHKNRRWSVVKREVGPWQTI